MRDETFRLFGVAIFTALATNCSAQMNLGEIASAVTDPAGHVIAGAVVTATNSNNGAKFVAQTSEAGLLSFGNSRRGLIRSAPRLRGSGTLCSRMWHCTPGSGSR